MTTQTDTVAPPAWGYVETTGAVATNVPGLSFQLADKQIDTFDVEVWIVQQNATTPSVGYIHFIAATRNDPAGSYQKYAPTAGTNPVVLASILADAGLAANISITGSVATVQVTGIAAHNYEWRVRVVRTTWSSTP